jgi:glycosyltransferase involved in cell wall biosynthesis
MVSIIITTYNNSSTLRRAVVSAINSKEIKVEIIVVNDGASDAEFDVINDLVDDITIKYYKKINGGLASARNFGVSKSKYNAICFLDADDEYSQFKVKKQFDVLDKNANGIVYSKCNILINNNLYRSNPKKITEVNISDKFYKGMIKPSGATFMMKKEIFEKIGGFNDDIRRNSELLFCCSLINNDLPIFIAYDSEYIQHLEAESNRSRLSFRLDSFKQIVFEVENMIQSQSDNRISKNIKDYFIYRLNLFINRSNLSDPNFRKEIFNFILGSTFASPEIRKKISRSKLMPVWLFKSLSNFKRWSRI